MVLPMMSGYVSFYRQTTNSYTPLLKYNASRLL